MKLVKEVVAKQHPGGKQGEVGFVPLPAAVVESGGPVLMDTLSARL